MIFRAAHDTDCIPGEELVNLERDRRIYQYGLNRADLISAQRVFLNTSDSEGFPNSFLQAWVRRVPVISYFDPDQVIAAKGLGVSVDTQNDFVAAISGLLGDEDERQEAGRRSRQFVVDRYSPDAIAVQYVRLIAEQFGITIDGL